MIKAPRKSGADMTHIVLIFHSSRNDNLGVGALTESQIAILRSVGERTGQEIRITIIDGEAERPVYVHGPDIEVRDIRVFRHPMQFFHLVRAADLVIDIGAGDSFTDIYGRKRLIWLFLMKYLTHLARRPLVLAPQTVGPFRSPVSRILAANSIQRCAVVSTRDAMSTECTRNLGVRKDIIEASDVALRLPYSKPVLRDGTGPVKVGINVSGLLMNGGYTGQNMFGLQVDYRQLISDLSERFINHPDSCELHFVPHVIPWGSNEGSAEDDMLACRELAKTFPGAKVAPAFMAPSEAKSYIAGLDFFMGARMHSCIAAFSSGVPVVPMAYSRKFSGLFGSLGYNYTVDCTSERSDVIIERIMKAFDNRGAVAEEVNLAFERGLDRLNRYENALVDLIDGLKSR